MRPLVTIDGVAIPDPSEYNATTSTVVDSARNVEGVMIGSVIRDDIAKIELTWKFITAEDWSKILRLFTQKYGGKFIAPVDFYNQVTNDWETRQMYVSDRTSSVFLRREGGGIRGYVGPRLALIEV